MKKLLLAFSFVLLITGSVFAANNDPEDIKAVDEAVSSLIQAFLKADGAALDKLAAADLIYVHSAGNVEDAAAFKNAVTSGKDKYLNVKFNYQTISTTPTAAIVSHIFDGTLISKGVNNEQPYNLHLGVVQVWKKEGGTWKIVARKSHRLPF